MKTNPNKCTPKNIDLHTMDECHFVDIPIYSDFRGILSVIKDGEEVFPFDFDRLFIITDVPVGAVRAEHAPKKIHELLCAYNGAFQLSLDDGKNHKRVVVNDPGRAFYLPSGIWRSLERFEPGTICVVLANGRYDKNESISDYNEYRRLVTGL
ncbi:MAG: WxcM-like domain-containing protein [Sedimenticola sp.]